MNAVERVIAFCDAKLAQAMREVERFKALFDTNPFDALVWSQAVFDAVAVLHVVGRVRCDVAAGKPLLAVRNELRALALEKATAPSRSNSAQANELARSEIAAMGAVLTLLLPIVETPVAA